jgi:hypothetical protein
VKGPNNTLVEQQTEMTMAQLMSHSAGFGVSAVYNDAGLGATDLQGMIDKLAKLPLETQPGTNVGLRPQREHPGLPSREAVRPVARRLF